MESIPSCTDCLNTPNSIFKNLTNDEFDIVTYKKSCSIYKKGKIIFRENYRTNGCYCVHSGVVKMYKSGVDGKEQIIRFAQKGDIIGFRSLLCNEVACTTAKIIEDATLCFIPAPTIFSLLKSNSAFSIELMKFSCKELGEANKYITDIAQKTVRERLAEVLLLLKKSFDLDDEKTLQISLTREEIANIVGTATESVIRLLSEFKSDNLIELNGRKIKIIDEKGLRKIEKAYD
ncbi:MAG: Crp/Fnr family transcriptional regulator [Bacteroidetes bacterium]|jgi:CRP/FNR family transcriptional regulator, polysaccharide utilization system transcription regulator|nr:Crp/Fnr family transcriptional regulator [Bacteroidota bacterium]MBT4967883.1 Crp/Fnr family transcriptional regulator [Bacteroidota bacterium]MBT6686808.1 Crp/Fnr family transcriptional regulator [Bacteroidota bacterium]MBT7144138.1 Crp/Fnr family transcriptional regulator [Bacteroidota bacterium]MBT7490074.1 Crp/Fnr family transcriptional regulator [Bacteroidota bacterium]